MSRRCGRLRLIERRSGVLCIVGIDGRDQRVELDGRELGLELVLKNGVIFGSISSLQRGSRPQIGST